MATHTRLDIIRTCIFQTTPRFSQEKSRLDFRRKLLTLLHLSMEQTITTLTWQWSAVVISSIQLMAVIPTSQLQQDRLGPDELSYYHGARRDKKHPRGHLSSVRASTGIWNRTSLPVESCEHPHRDRR